jgi:hypothetical protein
VRAKDDILEMLRQADKIAVVAKALRKEHERLSRTLALIKKDFRRAMAKPLPDYKLVQDRIDERQRQAASTLYHS